MKMVSVLLILLFGLLLIVALSQVSVLQKRVAKLEAENKTGQSGGNLETLERKIQIANAGTVEAIKKLFQMNAALYGMVYYGFEMQVTLAEVVYKRRLPELRIHLTKIKTEMEKVKRQAQQY